MTLEETIKIIRTLFVAYPSEFGKVDPKECAGVWHTMLGEYDYVLVGQAVKSLIATEHYPPKIADVIDKINMLTTPAEMAPEEAWHLVRKALRNGYYGYAKEYSKLPKPIQTALGSEITLKEWSMIGFGELDTVIKSYFLRAYTAIAKRESDYSRLPESAKRMMERMEDTQPSYDISLAEKMLKGELT